MIQYIIHIILPYVEAMRESLGEEDAPALVIMDNFKGQITSKLLEENSIHTCILPPNTTDLLQPMDLSVNKPAKEFLRQKFQEWYADQVVKLSRGQDIETAEIEPVNLVWQY